MSHLLSHYNEIKIEKSFGKNQKVTWLVEATQYKTKSSQQCEKFHWIFQFIEMFQPSNP